MNYLKFLTLAETVAVLLSPNTNLHVFPGSSPHLNNVVQLSLIRLVPGTFLSYFDKSEAAVTKSLTNAGPMEIIKGTGSLLAATVVQPK